MHFCDINYLNLTNNSLMYNSEGKYPSDGANRTRTGGFHNAIVTLYQLSYNPLTCVYYIALCCCFSQESYLLATYLIQIN